MALNVGFIANQRQPQIDIPDPVADQAKGYQLRELAMKDRMSQQAMADDQAQRQAFSQAGGDQAKYLQALATGGNYKAYQGAQKAALDTDKAKADIGHVNAQTNKQQTDAQLAMLERGSSILATAKDQRSYDAARQALAQTIGPQAIEKLNPVFDPMLVQGYVNAGLKRADQLKNETQLLAQKETARHNTATEGLTARGQNMVNDRAREANGKGQYDAERGLLIDPRTGQARQVVGVDGQPIAPKGGNAKMTEDQGKATGWLIQAENAFKNMRESGFDAKGNPKSAAYPGINDAIGSVTGLGGLANSMRGADRQKFIQSSSSLSEALLRAATGAGVNESEAKQKIAELTPLFGEDKETTKQKMEAIPLYLEALKVRAGPGAEKARVVTGSGGATGDFSPKSPAKTKAGASVSNW